MDIQQEIFTERVRLDIRSQPHCALVVKEMASWFRNHSPLRHPYDQTFCTLPCFLETCTGHAAVLPSVSYVYRIAKLTGIFYKDSPKPYFRRLDAMRLFQHFSERQHLLGRSWLDLSFYFPDGANLSAKRNCSWWTSDEANPTPLLPSAHKSGMPNDWVNAQTLLLRIPAVSFARLQAKVPTPVDAFDSCIFLAQPAPGATVGTAIDLSSKSAFLAGNTEVVVGDIPVEIVEALPIEVNHQQREAFPVSLEPLLQSLRDYYKSL